MVLQCTQIKMSSRPHAGPEAACDVMGMVVIVEVEVAVMVVDVFVYMWGRWLCDPSFAEGVPMGLTFNKPGNPRRDTILISEEGKCHIKTGGHV